MHSNKTNLIQTKLKASLIHLAVSAIVALLCAVLIFKVWYPTPWSDLLGVGQIVLLMLAIDVCIGPVLTFIIYRVGKKTLKMDLAIIAGLQIAALCYGIYTVGVSRPAYLVYSQKAFNLVTANEVYSLVGTGKSATTVELNPWVQPLLGYRLVSEKNMFDEETLNSLAFSQAGGGPSAANFPATYAPYANVLSTHQKNAKPLRELNPKTISGKKLLELIKQRYPIESLTSPVYVKNQLRLLALLNPLNGEILGFESVDGALE